MKLTKPVSRLLIAALALLICFVILLLLVTCVDIRSIGPANSEIGLSTLNAAVRDAIGQNDTWYNISEVLGLLPLASAAFFALLGVYQLITRKSLKQVDQSLYLLAGFYVAVAVLYVFFEIFVINFRPVLGEGGELEASFPSSHTMLSLCFLGALAYQCAKRIRNKAICITAIVVCVAVALTTVAARTLSGVHWLTDIIGGILISAALLLLYIAVNFIAEQKDGNHTTLT